MEKQILIDYCFSPFSTNKWNSSLQIKTYANTFLWLNRRQIQNINHTIPT